MDITYIAVGAGLILLFFMFVVTALSRYKRCSSDEVLVITGKVGDGRSARCIHGGAALVWPVIQDYQYMSLTPMSIDIDLKGALSRQNIRVNAPASFTVGISTADGVMQRAAERLLGLTADRIQKMAEEIIMGQMRQVIASLSIEEINSDREKLIAGVSQSVDTELAKIGLHLINVNIRDVNDQGGYIEALGKEAAAKAVSDARIKVAQAERDGAIGEARAKQEQTVSVAAAAAESKKGENDAQITIAASEAGRRQAEAESRQKAETAERIAAAKTSQDSYAAQEEAEKARAALEGAKRRADEIVPAEIERQKVTVQAEAAAEKQRIEAEGQAKAILSIQKAEAEGIRAKLEGRAEGFKTLTESCGAQPTLAINLLLVDKLPELVKSQAEAISQIKLDKVVVFDGGNGNGVAGFLNSLAGALPPLHELAKQAGIELPPVLGKASATTDEPPKPKA